MDLGLHERIAIVTGASQGMGFATALALAREGARVLMIARTPATLETAAAAIRAEGGEVAAMAGDVADAALAERALDECLRGWGGVHILVNNAGGPPMGSTLEHAPAAWNAAIEQNLLAAVRFSRTVMAPMRDQKWGRIVSITSTTAKEPTPAMVLSATTRAGIGAFTKAIAIELAPFNVTANVVCPGGVLTGRLRDLLKARATREGRDYETVLAETEASIPARRFATPDEIADVIVFLASERAAYLNGVSLCVDGALTRGF